MYQADGISVVIPNYNGATLLPEILPTVFAALENTSLPYEVIVADDASTDSSISWLEREYPQVSILRSATNGGFSVTANRGILNARYTWVLLLNSDVKLSLDYFSYLLPYCERNNLFGVTGRMIGWEDNAIQDGGKYPVFQGAKIKTSYDFIPADDELTAHGLPCFYLSGANAFINKKVFETIGSFNEIFSPYYVEDTELSLRAWRLGYTCLYEHRAICRHRTSSTIGNPEKRKQVERIYNRNKYYLHAIHLNGAYLLSWFIQLKLELFFRMITFRWTAIQSYWDFIKNSSQVVKSRKTLRNLQPEKKLLSVQAVFSSIHQQLKPFRLRIFKR
jgi:GT2 family glycosyltransferase